MCKPIERMEALLAGRTLDIPAPGSGNRPGLIAEAVGRVVMRERFRTGFS